MQTPQYTTSLAGRTSAGGASVAAAAMFANTCTWMGCFKTKSWRGQRRGVGAEPHGLAWTATSRDGDYLVMRETWELLVGRTSLAVRSSDYYMWTPMS